MSQSLAPREAFVAELAERSDTWRHALPPSITPEKFVAVVRLAVAMTPDLLNCDRKSLWRACLLAAKDGLLPDGREAAMVPYQPFSRDQSNPLPKIVQYMPMYQGLLKRARQSGQIASVVARTVYDGDEFHAEFGDDERIVHRPAERNRGKPRLAYCIIRLTDGSVIREVLWPEDAAKVRAVSRAKKGPWFDWEEEMLRKTVFRRASKWAPWSTELIDLDREDNAPAESPPPRPTFPADVGTVPAIDPLPSLPAHDEDGVVTDDEELTPEQQEAMARYKAQLGEGCSDE